MKNRYDSEQTVNDILDVAAALFIEKGYEKTSIQDIVKGLNGLTRGAIYHHFDSKDAIINAVLRRMLPQDDTFALIKKDTTLNGLEKLRAVLLSSVTNEDVAQIFFNSVSLLNNPRFLVEFLRINNEVFAPEIMSLLDEGNRDGSCNVPYTKELSEAILLLISTWFTSALYTYSHQEYNNKLALIKMFFDGIGFDLLNDELFNRLQIRIDGV